MMAQTYPLEAFEGADGITPAPGDRELNIVPWDEIRMEPVRWLIPDRIPFGELIIAEGDGGLGKTSAMLDIGARLSSGSPMPDGTPTEPSVVLIIADEDRQGILKARLLAAGADLANVHLVASVGEEEDFFTLPRDVAALHRSILRFGARFVLLDALFSHLDGDLNAHKAQDVRKALRPVSTVAHETGCAILGIRHWRKGVGSAADRGMGSVDIRNVARSVLSIGPNPNDETVRVIAVSKSNLGRPSRSLTFTLEDAQVAGDNGEPVPIGRVRWGEETDLSADDIASAAPPSSEERTKTEDCKDFLLDLLADGPRPSQEVIESAKEAGFSRMTTHRAAKGLRVTMTREGFPSRTHWGLPDAVIPQSCSHPSYSNGKESGATDGMTEPGDDSEAAHAADRVFDIGQPNGRTASRTTVVSQSYHMQKAGTTGIPLV